MSAFNFSGLPEGVGQYFTTSFVGLEVLTTAEQFLLTNLSAQKRINDFSTGRFCARQALAQIGIAEVDILRKNQHEPLWPEGIVGSISHSGRMVGAVASKSESIKGIGLDIETIGGVKANMWRLLFTGNEQTFLTQQNDTALYSTIFFSIKESFYKMQYPLLQAEPDFLDAEIQMRDNELVIYSELFDPQSLKIHWEKFEDQVITIVIAAG